ncbi:hypothetical protein DERP_013095 [Dermatophagoides pteronyssinus]|uniref:Uncharacterized protein n=1 Tax=Dermatophagoides pteronyssinus TaxID=6956 RepID=A0ABQ8J5R4_DERPT|nr:hypothetical protein DERP_013095 [Dermatophagoides pteronyssinus]
MISLFKGIFELLERPQQFLYSFNSVHNTIGIGRISEREKFKNLIDAHQRLVLLISNLLISSYIDLLHV